jgi:potassium efflux system protein
MTVVTSDFSRAVKRTVMFSAQLWLRLLLGLLILAPLSQGQIPGIPVKQPEAAPSGETAEQADARIKLWLKEARTVFARVNEPSAEQELPEGIELAELIDYRRNLEQIISGINRYLKIAESIPIEAKALEAARELNAAWHGFKEMPPYSILMLDELINQQDAIREKDASYRSSLALFERTLSGVQDEARGSGDARRRILSAVADNPAADGAANWRLEADNTKSRLLAVRAQLLRSNITLLKDQSETTKLQLLLLDRQIATARKKATFSEADLEKLKMSAADRQAALLSELNGIRKRGQEANAVKNRMQNIKDQLLKTTPEGTPLESTPDLALATVKMEASETRVDSLQFVAATLELLSELETDGIESYLHRKTVLAANSNEAREAALQILRTSYDRMTARGIVLSNELAAINADISRQEARASSRSADDPRLLPLNDVRASLWDKQAVIQRAVQMANSQSRMMKRWLDEFDELHASRPLRIRFTEGIASAWASLKSLWVVDVFTYNDTVMIGGVASTQERGVTLGKFFIAISAFLISYFIANRIKNRLRNTIVRRGHIAEAQAKTLSNWSMIVVVLLLAVSTLHFLRIPITVFAFFGGALAIGIGFGMQTLIKNFISGIIVLAERKIRVGDILDLNGVVGTVIEINTRSSIIRSADDIETMVPNSIFLENRVTNWTLSNSRIRRTLRVIAPYGSSPQRVMEILTDAAKRHGLILKDPEPYAVFEDYGDTYLVFNLFFWINLGSGTNGTIVASDLRLMIEKHLTEMKLGTHKTISEQASEPTTANPSEPHDSEPAA